MGIAGLVRVMTYKLIGTSNSPPITTVAMRIARGISPAFSFRSTMGLDYQKGETVDLEE